MVAGDVMRVALRQGKFDVRDGSPTCAPVTEALRIYPVKVDGRRVDLQIE